MRNSSSALEPEHIQNTNIHTIYQHLKQHHNLCTCDDIYTIYVYDMPCDNI